MEFSELALQKLLQAFPELSSFIVTFKDITDEVNRSEDSDVSVGMFILQFGTSWCYIPVMSKGEAIQPIDSVFNLEKQQFVPLTKAIVNNLVAMSQSRMGKPAKMPSTMTFNPSVYDMVTPPRTGKYVYASSSRLVEFLAITPNMVKQAVMEAITTEKDIYSGLHKFFGLENMMAALKPTTPTIVVKPKPAVELITEGTGLDNEVIQEILHEGYSLRGENQTNRVAVLALDGDKVKKLRQITSSDAGMDYELVFRDGTSLPAYVPMRSKAAPQFAALLRNYSKGGDPVFSIFENGDYAIGSTMVSRGEGVGSKQTLQNLFSNVEPKTPKDVADYENFVIFSPELEVIGVYSANSVKQTSDGVCIQARSLIPFVRNRVNGSSHEYEDYRLDYVCINAFRNCKTINFVDQNNVFIPYNSLVVTLGVNRFEDLESNINSAAAKLELTMLEALGSAVNLGYDGVEFTYNNKPIGSEMNMIEMLVVRDGIEPTRAKSFIKQAKEQRHVKIFLSKKADFEPSEVPQYGEMPPDQPEEWGSNGGITKFKDGVKDSLGVGDAQTVESTIISELLQVSNMQEYITEYLPDIEKAIDKLGRVLFLTRLNLGEMSEKHSAGELTSFISNLRNVYCLLGDNYIKLMQLVQDSASAKMTGK